MATNNKEDGQKDQIAGLEQLSSIKAHGGNLFKFQFNSNCLGGLKTAINLFIPPTSSSSIPVIYYLAGLTCNEDTGAQKGGFLSHLAKHGIAMVFPDTSPRGAKIEGEENDWDFGTGAGFYLDATHPKWRTHYRMECFIVHELPQVLKSLPFSLDLSRQSIMGHSMGGHGALTIYLNHSEKFKSCSGFAPILNPTQCAWGTKAFTGPNGNDGYLIKGLEEGAKYDATELIARKLRDSPDRENLNILIDYGTRDQFYKDGQLLPENFLKAIHEHTPSDHSGEKVKLNVQVRKQADYDHSYYFISSFGEEHIDFHSKLLL